MKKKRTSSKTKRKNKHSVIFPAHGFKALVLFCFFLFLFLMEQLPVILTFGKATVRVRSPENQRAGPLNELCVSLPCYELFRFTILAVYKALEKYLAKKQSTEFIKNNKIPFQVMFLLPDECEVSWHLIFFTVWEFVSHPPNFLSDDWTPISTQQVPVCLTWQSILLMSQCCSAWLKIHRRPWLSACSVDFITRR